MTNNNTDKNFKEFLKNLADKQKKNELENNNYNYYDKKSFIEEQNNNIKKKVNLVIFNKDLEKEAKKGKYRLNVYEMDSTHNYNCFDLQKMVKSMNESVKMPLPLKYEQYEYTDTNYEYTDIGVIMHKNSGYSQGIGCRIYFAW